MAGGTGSWKLESGKLGYWERNDIPWPDGPLPAGATI